MWALQIIGLKTTCFLKCEKALDETKVWCFTEPENEDVSPFFNFFFASGDFECFLEDFGFALEEFEDLCFFAKGSSGEKDVVFWELDNKGDVHLV